MTQAITPKVSKPLATACYHCGEAFKIERIHFEDKEFCCEGCRTVYEILQTNDLCGYYDLEGGAGVTVREKVSLSEFTYLDQPEISEKLIRFSDGKSAHITFALPQIHCPSCIWLLENLYKINPAILSTKVDFLHKEIHLVYSIEEAKLSEVVHLLASLGYLPELSLGRIEKKVERDYQRTLVFKIAVAGFCFGNIMLLSFPEYLGLDKVIYSNFFRLFGYLNIVLSIPVLFFSASDYLKNAWLGIKHRQLNLDIPLALGMVAFFARSLYEILSGHGAGYMDSMAGLVFFLLVGKWFQQRTFGAMSFERDYKSYFPIAAVTITAEGEKVVPIRQLKSGDKLIIRNGELLPADGILLNGEAMIDYSFVTGESDPVHVKTSEKLYAGGRQTGGAIVLETTQNVDQSYLTGLWNLDGMSEEKSVVTDLADSAGKRFTISILVISLVSFLYWLQYDFGIAINAATAVMIIACPCAVALAIPFTLSNAMRLLGRKGFYLKNTGVLEALNKIDCVVLDKTGTLTEGDGAQNVTFQGKQPNEEQMAILRSLTKQSIHPVSQQVGQYLGEGPTMEVAKFKEVTGKGMEAMVDGKLVRLGSAGFIGVENAAKGTYLSIDGEVLGCFVAENKYRENIFAILADLRLNHKDIFLLSGDNDREREALEAHFHPDNLHFNQSPSDKYNFIKQLQDKGRNVLMLGDGLNDAGALRKANCGIAVSEKNSGFNPASDAILDAESMPMLTHLLVYARNSIKVVYVAFAVALVYNIVGLSFGVTGQLSPLVAAVLMPLSSVTIVLIGVGLTSLLGRRLRG